MATTASSNCLSGARSSRLEQRRLLRVLPFRRRGADEAGAAFFAVILLTALLLSLGIFGTHASMIELSIAGNDLQAKRALQAAEAGLSHALSLIKQKDVSGNNGAADGFDDELSAGGTGGALAALGSVVNLNGEAYRFRHFGSEADSDGYYVRAVDNDDETNGLNDPTVDKDRRIHLISLGRVNGAERVIDTVVERDPAFRCVLCGTQDTVAVAIITLSGAVATDSFNSDNAPYDVAAAGSNGNLQSNGDIDLNGAPQIDVHGSVTAGRSVVEAGTVNVSGATSESAATVGYPSVAPCGPPYPPNQGITGGLYDQALGTLVNVGANDVVDLAPGSYCFSSIVMTGASTLRVSGPTRVSLTLPSTIRGVVNTTNVASNLRIYSSVQSPLPPAPVVPGLVITGGVQAAMAIYAPDAVVTFSGLADFYGAAVGAILPNVGVPRLHYDEALKNPGLQMASWRELRNYIPN